MMAAEKTIKVLIIDDSESIRVSLHRFLNVFRDLEWVGESSNGSDALIECARLSPDVVLIDVALPHIDVSQVTRSIRYLFPGTQVIGTVGFEEQAVIESILDAGAIRCVSKMQNIYLIVDAVRQAARTSDSQHLVDRTG